MQLASSNYKELESWADEYEKFARQDCVTSEPGLQFEVMRFLAWIYFDLGDFKKSEMVFRDSFQRLAETNSVYCSLSLLEQKLSLKRGLSAALRQQGHISAALEILFEVHKDLRLTSIAWLTKEMILFTSDFMRILLLQGDWERYKACWRLLIRRYPAPMPLFLILRKFSDLACYSGVGCWVKHAESRLREVIKTCPWARDKLKLQIRLSRLLILQGEFIEAKFLTSEILGGAATVYGPFHLFTREAECMMARLCPLPSDDDDDDDEKDFGAEHSVS
jgi:tetratricopeptide (TPR) repeat protein